MRLSCMSAEEGTQSKQDSFSFLFSPHWNFSWIWYWIIVTFKTRYYPHIGQSYPKIVTNFESLEFCSFIDIKFYKYSTLTSTPLLLVLALWRSNALSWILGYWKYYVVSKSKWINIIWKLYMASMLNVKNVLCTINRQPYYMSYRPVGYAIGLRYDMFLESP